jgi:hypothetical protein
LRSRAVGFQLTRAAADVDDRLKCGLCTVNKSKDYILEQVVNKGFLFNAMLYEGGEWKGVI